jgi:WD40 repeat protein
MGWLAALTIDGRVRLWKRKDFGTGGLNSPLRGGDAVRAADLALSPKGADGKCRWLLVGGIDGTGRLWDLQDTQTAPAALTGHASAVIDVGFSPNGQWAVTTALDGRARFWDMNVFAQGVRAEPATFSFSRSAPPSTAISADGQFIAMASNTQVQLTNIDGRSRCWDAAGPDGVVSAIRFGATNRELVTAASDGTLTRWELSETAPTVVSRETKMIDRIPDSSSCFAMNGGALIAGEDAWLLVGRKQPVRLQASTTPTQPLVPSAGGRFLTTVEAKQVTIWQIDPEYSKLSQSRVFTKQDFQTQKEAVVADVSADGRLVAIGFADGTIGLYPLEGKNGKTEIGHGEMIRSVRFSPDGSRLATAAADGSLRLWNLTGGLDRARSMNLVGHNRQIRSIDFSADGRALLTVSDDGTIKVWSVTLERLLERAEALLRER